jgi:hypothetical protein
MKAFLLDKPDIVVTEEELKEIGVLHWVIDVDNLEREGKLDALCKERGYSYKDVVRTFYFVLLKSLWIFDELQLTRLLETEKCFKFFTVNSVLFFWRFMSRPNTFQIMQRRSKSFSKSMRQTHEGVVVFV